MKAQSIWRIVWITFLPVSLFAQSEIFISEYVEGNSNNKAVEFYNPTSASISLVGYAVSFYSNGSITSSATIQLTGSIASHRTYVLGHSSGVSELKTRSNQLGLLTFNGDDAVVLTKNGLVIDAVGRIGEDPGDFWGVAPVKTQNQTIRRKPAICTGDVNSSDVFDPSVEWLGFNIDDFSDLGSHYTDTCGSTGGTGTNAIVNINTTAVPVLKTLPNSNDSGFIIAKETDGTITLPIVVQNPANVASSLTAIQVGGNGTLGTDIVLTAATFDANATTSSNLLIQLVDDGNNTEGVEQIKLELQGSNTTPTGVIKITLWLMDNDLPQTTLNSGQTGETLRTALSAAYSVCNTDFIEYDEARDLLYGTIYRLSNLDVCGFYENYCINLPNGVDPSTYLYSNGSNDGINAEHIWPQSKGAAAEPLKSDMHHIRPTRSQVNTIRNNNPYGDITAAQTTHWFYQNQNLSTAPPVADQDLYSRYSSMTGTFMPRASVKGDVARASIYVYTVYNATIDLAYWNVIKPLMLAWHLADPVDVNEAYRNLVVASYQCNTLNPFIIDPSLVSRVLSVGTAADDVQVEVPTEGKILALYPNPIQDRFILQLANPQSQMLSVRVLDLLGRTVQVFPDSWQEAGTATMDLTLNPLPKGVYLLQIETSTQRLHQLIHLSPQD